MNINKAIRSVGRPCGKIDSRKEILHATKLLCLSKDIEQITTRLISDRSGFNVGLIRYYFGNKDGLIQDMLKEQLTRFNAQLKRVLNQDTLLTSGGVIQSCFLEASKDIETISLIVKLTGYIKKNGSSLEEDENINDYFYRSIQEVIKNDIYFVSCNQNNIDSQMSTFINLLLSPVVNSLIDINSPTIQEQQRVNYEILTAIIEVKKL